MKFVPGSDIAFIWPVAWIAASLENRILFLDYSYIFVASKEEILVFYPTRNE